MELTRNFLLLHFFVFVRFVLLHVSFAICDTFFLPVCDFRDHILHSHGLHFLGRYLLSCFHIYKHHFPASCLYTYISPHAFISCSSASHFPPPSHIAVSPCSPCCPSHLVVPLCAHHLPRLLSHHHTVASLQPPVIRLCPATATPHHIFLSSTALNHLSHRPLVPPPGTSTHCCPLTAEWPQ